MALTQAVITVTAADLGLDEFDTRRTKLWARTNIPGETIVDPLGNQIYLGASQGTITLLTATVDVPVPGAGSWPASWQTYIYVDYQDSAPGKHSKGHVVRTFGPFDITGDANLADLVVEQQLPPDFDSVGILAQIDAISGLTGEDDAFAYLVSNPSDSQTALDRRYGRVLTPESFGATGDGVTNDSTAMTALFAALQDGDTIQTRKGATYRFVTPLTSTGRSKITWQGEGKLVFAGTVASTSGAVSAIRFTNLTDSRLTIDLEVETQNRQYSGISLSGTCRNVVYDRTKVYNARWIGLGNASTCTDITYLNCVALRCYVGGFFQGARWRVIGGRYSSEWTQTQEYIDDAGVWDASSLYYDGAIVGGTDWSIVGASFDDCGQSGIYGGANLIGGTITGCTIVGNWNKGIDFGIVGASNSSLREITITGNYLRDNDTGDIHLDDGEDCVISANVTKRTNAANTYSSIILNSLSLNNVVSANRVTMASTTAAGIFLNTQTTGNLVANNLVKGTVAYTVNTVNNTLVHGSGTQAVGASMVAGKHYVTPNTSLAAVIPAEGNLKAIPLTIGRPGTLDALSVSVTVAGSTGAVVRLGVYADDGTGAMPGTLIATGAVGSATADCTTTGVKTVTLQTPLKVLPGQILWLAAAVQGGATTRPTLRFSQSVTGPMGGTAATVLDNTITGAEASGTHTGALPTPFAGFQAASVPRVAARAA